VTWAAASRAEKTNAAAVADRTTRRRCRWERFIALGVGFRSIARFVDGFDVTIYGTEKLA
jgi:hypothetical protein